MNKLIKNTIIIIGIILCAIVLALNVCVTSTISDNLEEKVKTSINSPIKLIITGILVVLICIASNKMKRIKISKKR